MITLFKQALNLQNYFQINKWKYCFIGGISLQRWGEPRLTVDIDVTLLTGFGTEAEYIDTILTKYKGRIKNTRQFAIKNRVLLLKTPENIDIDIALGGLPFEELMIKRATYFKFLPEISLLTCSAEDLIILKTFADRTKDWLDVENIIIKQGKQLNSRYIQKQLTPLCKIKKAPHIMQKLTNLLQKKIKK